MAEPSRGMGRGLAALLTPSATAGAPGDRDLRQLPVELITPNPRQPRRSFDEEALIALAGSLGERGVLQPVLVRPLGRRHLRADRRRAPLARRAAGRAPDHPRARPHPRRRRVARARADREHGPRGPQPGRGGARVRAAGRGARAHARGDRPPRRPLARRGLEPPAPARPPRRGARDARRRRPDRGPRPRDPAWPATTTTAAGSPAPRSPRAGTSAAPRPRPARCPKARRDDGPVRAARGTVHPDQEAAASRLGEAFGRALGADVKVTPRGTGYKVALTFDSLDEALELASRIGTAEPV